MTIRSLVAPGHASSLRNFVAAAALLGTDAINKFDDFGFNGGGSKKTALPIKGDAALKNTTIVGDGFKCVATNDDLVDDRLGTAKHAGPIDATGACGASDCHCAASNWKTLQ